MKICNSVKNFIFALAVSYFSYYLEGVIRGKEKMNIRELNSLIYLKKGRQAAEANEIETCVSSYAKGFYLRCTDEDFFDIEFSSFFYYQFRVFLLSRGNFDLSLSEGDEVSKLIRKTYEEMRICLDYSPFNIQGTGEWNLLRRVEIDFSEKRTPFLTA